MKRINDLKIPNFSVEVEKFFNYLDESECLIVFYIKWNMNLILSFSYAKEHFCSAWEKASYFYQNEVNF